MPDEFPSAYARAAAIGDYGFVLRRSRPYESGTYRPDTDPESLTVIARASTLRQLGRYPDAQLCDELAVAAARTEPVRVAAWLGLAADAVGQADPALARQRAAVRLPADRPDLLVLAGWIHTEVALLEGDPLAAVAAAAGCVGTATEMVAPWHLAKSRLFVGVARLAAGEPAGADDLRACLAAGYPALTWVAAAVLGEREAARAAVARIAEGLPADVRAGWLARPDVAPYA
ncbi:hypothetical protein [Fodinicola acaciae]|uniref:hypothetical protein n=1 Tax=Fodinicola acaciae TaxID=2681555 RepID=UPI0013D5B2B0|nr:hypothetical protein [Fodinicola acaciae]